MNLKVILTSWVFPPIPWRGTDYCAWYDGREEEGPVGNGATESEAIINLLEQEE